jgi:DNA-binding MarR family transcriptional regulator
VIIRFSELKESPVILKKIEKNSSEMPESEVGTSELLLGRAGFLLNKAAQKVREFYEEQLRPLGLNGKDYGVMVVLEEKGSISQHEIGMCIYIDRTTMVGIIDNLEKRGLVERKEHPTDRRSHSIYLTPKGKDTLSKAHHLGIQVEKRFLNCLGVKEQKEFLRLLKQLVITHYGISKEKV